MLFPTFYLFICATALFQCCLGFSIAGTNMTDYKALLEIKAKISNDPLGVTSSWNDTLHYCKWHGVTCGRRHQRVTRLDLQSSKLTGIISPYVGNLSFLRALQLMNNSFSGIIPSEIGRLHRLQQLLLNNNSIGGQLPSNLSGCSNLVTIHVYLNRLVGTIPPELGFMSNLQVLTLSRNSLTGTIPSSLGNLSSLTKLFIAENNLVGSVPDSLGNLKNLSIFSLSENKLFGVVPPSIFNISSMTKIDIGTNYFQGNLPSDLGNTLPNLNYFSIYTNNFSGHIPSSISNSSYLSTLNLGVNNLQGQVPSLANLENLERLVVGGNLLGIDQATDLSFIYSLANASSILQWLDIAVNDLKGKFPEVICNFSVLSYLRIQFNKIGGQVPACIGNLAEMEIFNAQSNQLSGVIPPSIGKLQYIGELDLSNNQFSGEIPSSIGNITQLTYLQLSGNNLEGHIPLALAKCVYLSILDLSKNYLSGSIPPEIVSISSLAESFNLYNNNLTGSLPEEVGNLKKLLDLDFSNNMISGEIPGTLSSCVELTSLNLGENSFQGNIPQALEALTSLLGLDLSDNNLSGDIPKFLTSLPLQYLGLSNNHLEGKVPTGGVFNYPNNVSLTGNKGLCGGKPELNLPNCASSHRRTHQSIVGIVLGILGVLIMVALLLLYFFCYRKRTKKPILSDDSGNFPHLSYQMLLKATNDFSEENLIGSGSFGDVYMGILDDKSIVAIKIFKLEFHGASKSFMAECGVLRSIRHRNLVKVITACSSTDYQDRDFKALVYEYMPNGSLEDWLHPGEATNKKLNLEQRLDIAVDISIALEYLHYHCGASIVHCDLKPSNILLSDEMVAHVSDFGLAKFLPQGINNSQTNQSSSIGVRGTIGYTPPGIKLMSLHA